MENMRNVIAVAALTLWSKDDEDVTDVAAENSGYSEELGIVILDEEDGEDGDIVTDMPFEDLLYLLTLDDRASGPVSTSPCIMQDPSDVPAYVLNEDERRCQVLQAALKLKSQRDALLHAYLIRKYRRNSFGIRISEADEAWKGLSKEKKAAKSNKFREYKRKLYAHLMYWTNQARNAWGQYSQYKELNSDVESAAWDKYFTVREEVGLVTAEYAFGMRLLKQQEFNPFWTTGYGSEVHDAAWVNPDPRDRVEAEMDSQEMYWGTNRTWLPAKDRRRAMYAAKKAPPPVTDEEWASLFDSVSDLD